MYDNFILWNEKKWVILPCRRFRIQGMPEISRHPVGTGALLEAYYPINKQIKSLSALNREPGANPGQSRCGESTFSVRSSLLFIITDRHKNRHAHAIEGQCISSH